MGANSDTTLEQPRLEQPGAGIPGYEAFLFRVIGFGLATPLVSWNLARRLFQREGRSILQIAEGLSEGELRTRVLIPRLRGIEDSSRFWSPAMTLAHLIIVGDAVSRIIIQLGGNRQPERAVRIEDVKPDPDSGPEMVAKYRKLLARFDRRMTDTGLNRRSRLTHVYPWVGPLTAHQWLNLAAVHQRLHRKQIRSILKHAGTEG